MAEVHEFRIGVCTIHRDRGLVRRPGGNAHLEPRAMDLLVALAERAGRTVSRDELIDAVWGHPHVSDEALSRCVSQVRHALGDDRTATRFVETIPKRGYRLTAEVSGIDAGKAPTTITLAVLPLLNLSGDPADDHVADGLTELLITNLASLTPLRVISRTSSMHYKGTRMRLTEIARELGVTRILEGSVLRSARQLQVVVQLVDPSTDTQLFTRTYTRDINELLRLQNEIAWTVAQEIGAKLDPGSRDHMPQAPPIGEDALGAYLRARHFWAQRTPEGFQRAIQEYEACLATEPEFVAALAGLALTLEIIAFYGVVPGTSVASRARELVQRALALDPNAAETLCAFGVYRLFFEWDLSTGEDFLRRAVAANPSYDIARLGYGDTLLFRGDFDGALREIFAAVRMNPFDLGMQLNVGDFLIFAGRYEEAAKQLEYTLELGPHFWPARCRLAETLARLGKGTKAKAELTRASEDIPVARVHQPRVMVHALLGEHEPALALLRELEATRAERYVPPWEIARGYAALGEADAAFKWIDAAIDEHAPQLLGLGIMPGYEPIRADARFVQRLRRIGLPI